MISCRTTSPSETPSIYRLPPVPLERRLETQVIKRGEEAREDGLLLTTPNARNFLKNEIEFKNYVKKLTLLLKSIEESSNIEIKGEWYK